MKPEYADWIAQNVPANPWTLCAGITVKMAAAFPELRRVRGHYHCPIAPDLPNGTPHWWLVAPDGSIVDPTASQFVSGGAGEYVEHVGDEPTGKCMDCGAYTYRGESFCSTKCEHATAAYMSMRVERSGRWTLR